MFRDCCSVRSSMSGCDEAVGPCGFQSVLRLGPVDKTAPSVMAALDVTLRRVGGAPTYLLTDNETTVTTEHIAGIAVRNRRDGGVRPALLGDHPHL